MKNLSKWWPVVSILLATLLYISACKDLNHEEITPQLGKSGKLSLISTDSALDSPRTSTSSPYLVTLETVSNNGDGSYTWTYTVQNPDPLTGEGGTIPPLSYLDLSLGRNATSSDVISISTSPDGDRWTTTFNPVYRPDLGQVCYSDPVIQFQMGTTDSLKSYYRLTLNKNFGVEETSAVYQNSRGTCGTFQVSGVGSVLAEPANSCAYPSKYFFSKQGSAWSSVIVGGYTYSQAEAKAINSTNFKKGIVNDAKKCFLQVLAIKLSGNNVSPSASVWADVAIANNYLSTLGKLSPTNLPSGNPVASAAADRISTWINAHNCQRL